MLKVEEIISILETKPELYQPGAPLWTEPHIAAEMLKAHLSPDTDAASYRPETIEAICSGLPARMRLEGGARIVDLGCGPGLYCNRLGGYGFHMTGIDWSENSISYAKRLCRGRNADFVRASYLEPFGRDAFDGAILISQDYGVLAPDARSRLLSNIRAALKSGGRFAFDVPSAAAFHALSQSPALPWEAKTEGFWRAHPYLLLPKLFFYPAVPASCALYVLLDGKTTVYRVWQTYFTPESIERELNQNGFEVEEITSNLAGEKWRQDSPVIGVVCRSVEQKNG